MDNSENTSINEELVDADYVGVLYRLLKKNLIHRFNMCQLFWLSRVLVLFDSSWFFPNLQGLICLWHGGNQVDNFYGKLFPSFLMAPLANYSVPTCILE